VRVLRLAALRQGISQALRHHPESVSSAAHCSDGSATASPVFSTARDSSRPGLMDKDTFREDARPVCVWCGLLILPAQDKTIQNDDAYHSLCWVAKMRRLKKLPNGSTRSD